MTVLLNSALWANIFEQIPASLVTAVRNARHSALTFNKPATEKMLLRQVINLMLLKLDSKKASAKPTYRQAISALETQFGYTYGYRASYHWEAA